jgi:hypothetical protein
MAGSSVVGAAPPRGRRSSSAAAAPGALSTRSAQALEAKAALLLLNSMW